MTSATQDSLKACMLAKLLLSSLITGILKGGLRDCFVCHLYWQWNAILFHK